MKIIITVSIILTILLGCSTADKKGSFVNTEYRPPEAAYWPINDQIMGEKDFDSLDLYLNRVAKENPSQTTTWWVDYRRAQLWSKKNKNIACENFSRLAADPLFPIRRVAYLRAHEVCPKENQVLARLETFDMNKFDPWLTENALDVAIHRAEQVNNRQQLLDLYIKKSKTQIRKEEKLVYADKALSIATKLNDKSKIKETQNRIYALSPSRMPNPTVKEYISVANDYRYLRQFDKALLYYNKILQNKKSSLNEKLQAHRGIRSTYKIQQEKEAALQATENLAHFVKNYYKKSSKDTGDAKLYSETFLQLAKTYWTEDQSTRAVKTLDDIIKQTANKTSLAEVYWMRGRMDEEKQNYKNAIDWFSQALNQTIDNPAFRDKINWYLAWNLRKDGQYEKAIDILEKLVDKTDNNFEKSKLSFWLAKTYAQNKEDSDAKDIYKELAKQDSISYYGLLAYRELGEAIPVNALKVSPPTEKSGTYNLTKELNKIIDVNYFAWLAATRESEIAEDYLDHIASVLKKEKRDNLDTWASLLQLYANSQNYLGLFNQLNQLETTQRRSLLEKNPKLIFPNPYFETVTQAAGRFGISPEFIYSIMRQESSFNPQARSPMDAFGLMQLLPQVAKKSAAANSIDYNNPEDLYSPHINIPIGSAHLRELWDKYNGEVILAVASYNASEKAILGWLKTRFRGDTLEFIEDIPYDETRDYVKLVLRNLVTYQILSAQEDRFNFPEWTLKISGQDLNTPAAQ